MNFVLLRSGAFIRNAKKIIFCLVIGFSVRGGCFVMDGGVGEGATKGVPDGLSIGEGEGHGFWWVGEGWIYHEAPLHRNMGN